MRTNVEIYAFPTMSYLDSILVAGLISIFLLLGIAYRFVLLPFISLHFVEECRRDREAARRRRQFEGFCRAALFALAVFIGAGSFRSGLANLVPELSWTAGAVQLGALLVAALFCWGAINRWLRPFDC